MKQLRIGRRALLLAPLVLIVLFCGSGCNSTSSAQTQLATSNEQCEDATAELRKPSLAGHSH